MNGELRRHLRTQRNLLVRTLLSESHVRFCERCFSPFDFEPRPGRHRSYCTECKRELKSILNARRYVTDLGS